MSQERALADTLLHLNYSSEGRSSGLGGGGEGGGAVLQAVRTMDGRLLAFRRCFSLEMKGALFNCLSC